MDNKEIAFQLTKEALTQGLIVGYHDQSFSDDSHEKPSLENARLIASFYNLVLKNLAPE